MQEGGVMYLDTVVVAGLVTVGLVIAFGGGFAWFIKKDMERHSDK